MPYPGSVNSQRQKDASDRDVAIGQQILAVPAMYQRLTRDQQRVLMKRVEMPGASWSEIAESLGINKAAAWSRWQRAITILDRWEPETNDPNLWNMGQ
jgi:DNA-directed RNA polymerase specialized sigma24 family protein